MKNTISKWSIFAWALYDFASTIYSMNIVTLYFVLWVTVDMHGEDILYSFALSGSMLLAAITAPIFGSMSDKINKKMPFLIIFTVVAFIFTVLLGFMHSLLSGLLIFSVANLGYQLADVFYNALIRQISTEQNTGKISGLGKSFGYFGSIVGLLIVGPIVIKYGRQMAFIPTAILFLIFTIPCFFLVKDPPKKTKNKPRRSNNIFVSAASEVKHTLINIWQYPNLARSLIAIFWALNAVNTVFIFMSVYMEKVAGFSDADIQIFYISCAVIAIIGAFASGIISDFFGAKKTLMWLLVLWCFAILWAAIADKTWMFWVIGPLVGIGLGGVWTTARALIAGLAPEHMEGEIFGFYGLASKLSAVIAPMIWGLSVWAFKYFGTIKYRITMPLLVIFLLLGIIVLRKVPNEIKRYKKL